MPKKEILTYPDVTKGAKVAAKVRAACNEMTDAERENSFNRGMAVIYGRGNKQAAGVRH